MCLLYVGRLSSSRATWWTCGINSVSLTSQLCSPTEDWCNWAVEPALGHLEMLVVNYGVGLLLRHGVPVYPY